MEQGQKYYFTTRNYSQNEIRYAYEAFDGQSV